MLNVWNDFGEFLKAFYQALCNLVGLQEYAFAGVVIVVVAGLMMACMRAPKSAETKAQIIVGEDNLISFLPKKK